MVETGSWTCKNLRRVGCLVIQVKEMTREEKIAMYMRLTKRELVVMLLENQKIASILLSQKPQEGSLGSARIGTSSNITGEWDWSGGPDGVAKFTSEVRGGR